MATAINPTIKKSQKAVFGLFTDRASMESAVANLKLGGFRRSEISILFADGAERMDPDHFTESALSGALGWLAGLGLLAVPGMGPVVVAGPIRASMSAAGAGGTVGGMSGAMAKFGISANEAKRYEAFVREGGFLLSVHVSDTSWQKQAKAILEYGGATANAAKEEKSEPVPSQREFPRITLENKLI